MRLFEESDSKFSRANCALTLFITLIPQFHDIFTAEFIQKILLLLLTGAISIGSGVLIPLCKDGIKYLFKTVSHKFTSKKLESKNETV